MKRFNRTQVMGAVFLVFSLWVLWNGLQIPEGTGSQLLGPRLFPCISAAGMILMAVVSLGLDRRKKDEKEEISSYLDREGLKRLALILAECLLFCVFMYWIGFWFTAMAGTVLFILTLGTGKKSNLFFAVVFGVLFGSLCYFGFTRGFHIPLPGGALWALTGIRMP